MEPQPFLTGVNYWPRRKAMYWWPQFDASEVADEFDVIAALGMRVVRIFLLWDDWQPTPDTVSTQRLDDLGTVLDLAAERNLGLDITFFTGHMSGPNWSPEWLLDTNAPLPSPAVQQVVSGGAVVESSYRNMFVDPTAVDAARLLLDTVVGEYADHTGVWMWNLGNEPDLFAHPPTPGIGRRWVREMTGRIKNIDPNHPVTTGLHVESLLHDNGLRVNEVFAECDVAVMHGYPMYIPWARDPLDPDFVPFLCALTTALSEKPCLAEEWGGCTSPDTDGSAAWSWTAYGSKRTQFMAGEEQFAAYVDEVLPKLVEVGAPGAFMWCFADYARDLWDRPPLDDPGAKHERHFGLMRPDGSLKPHAESIKSFAASNPMVRSPKRTVTLDVDAAEFYKSPEAHAQRLYEAF